MKQMGGCEVSARLKRNSPNTPVLMITGWNDNLDINTLKSSGVDEVVTKPFNNKKLIETAENLYLSKKYHNR
jgi:CheY-like chemotaxis protein